MGFKERMLRTAQGLSKIQVRTKIRNVREREHLLKAATSAATHIIVVRTHRAKTLPN
jgi:hypothetical protein